MEKPEEIDGSLAAVAEAWQNLASTISGKTVIADMVRRFGYDRTSMYDGDTNNLVFKEGQRSVMVHVGRMLSVDPSSLTETEVENDFF